jgi:hypothetical protein
VTHAEIVAIAAAWLAKRCPVVVTELRTYTHETPDVLGFITAGPRVGTCLIECKVSRSDFLVDSKKVTRINSYMGMGQLRYYCCPTGMLKPDELPMGWGLIEVGAKARRKVKAVPFPVRNVDDEMRVLVSALRRAGSEVGEWISLNAYTHQTKCTATLSVEPEVQP